MRSVLRLTLLLLVVAGFLTPALASISADRSAVASTDPCPNKPILEQCVLENASEAVAPRGTVTVDAPCHGNAIEAQSPDLSTSRTARMLAFEIRSVCRAGWIPTGIDPPPRS